MVQRSLPRECEKDLAVLALVFECPCFTRLMSVMLPLLFVRWQILEERLWRSQSCQFLRGGFAVSTVSKDVDALSFRHSYTSSMEFYPTLSQRHASGLPANRHGLVIGNGLLRKSRGNVSECSIFCTRYKVWWSQP